MHRTSVTYINFVKDLNILPCTVEERFLNADPRAGDAEALSIQTTGFCAAFANVHSINATKVPFNGRKNTFECVLVGYVGTVYGCHQDETGEGKGS